MSKLNQATLYLAAMGCIAMRTISAASAAAPALSVNVTSQLQARMDSIYGAREVPVLQRAMTDSVSKALRSTNCGETSRIAMTLEDARPSHPTFKQQDADPALDPLQTHYLGGAAIKAQLLGPDNRVLDTLAYDYFAPYLRFASVSKDPWSDARLSIEQFASKLASTCHALSRGAVASH